MLAHGPPYEQQRPKILVGLPLCLSSPGTGLSLHAHLDELVTVLQPTTPSQTGRAAPGRSLTLSLSGPWSAKLWLVPFPSELVGHFFSLLSHFLFLPPSPFNPSSKASVHAFSFLNASSVSFLLGLLSPASRRPCLQGQCDSQAEFSFWLSLFV